MGIPYTLPKNYLLFIPMALTAFLGKEKVYTRQDMGIKKAPTRVTTGQKKNVSPLLERAFNFLSFTLEPRPMGQTENDYAYN